MNALRQSVIDKASATTAYGYDALVRLTQAKTTSSSGSVLGDLRYGYDASGNRTSDTVRQSGLLGTSDVTTASSFNPADQLTNRGSVTYDYDANGNQSGSSAGQALAYNPADQTTSLKRAGGSALGATYAGLSQVERATAGATTFTNTLLGVSAGPDAYTRDPAGTLVGIRAPTAPTTSSTAWAPGATFEAGQSASSASIACLARPTAVAAMVDAQPTQC